MIYIKEKEKIIRKNKWTTNYSKLFFRNQRKNCDKYMIFGSSVSSHGFVVGETGVFGFGLNEENQLGLGDCINRTTLVPIKFFSSKRVVKICCGELHSLFLIEKYQLYGTGSNADGQIGFKDIEDRKFPELVDIEGVDVLDVFAGFYHTIILDKLLDTYSFGYNFDGQLGIQFDNISYNNYFNSPTKSDQRKRSVYVCGRNLGFETGVNSNNCSLETPQKLLFFEKTQLIVLQIECGVDYTLFLTANNQVFGTGLINRELNLEDSTLFKNNERIISMKCGGFHSIYRSKEKIYMSGVNGNGQLGTGDCKTVVTPELFSIKGKKIVQSLLLDLSSIHFTKNEVYGAGNNELFRENKNKKQIFKIRDFKVKKFKNIDQKKKEIWERFEKLKSFVKETLI